jgi:hypothetical protein
MIRGNGLHSFDDALVYYAAVGNGAPAEQVHSPFLNVLLPVVVTFWDELREPPPTFERFVGVRGRIWAGEK